MEAQPQLFRGPGFDSRDPSAYLYCLDSLRHALSQRLSSFFTGPIRSIRSKGIKAFERPLFFALTAFSTGNCFSKCCFTPNKYFVSINPSYPAALRLPSALPYGVLPFSLARSARTGEELSHVRYGASRLDRLCQGFWIAMVVRILYLIAFARMQSSKEK